MKSQRLGPSPIGNVFHHLLHIIAYLSAYGATPPDPAPHPAFGTPLPVRGERGTGVRGAFSGALPPAIAITPLRG